jgi:hypothetical protein
MYSYVTMGTIAGFGGEAMGLRLHSHDLESHGVTHHVAPEAASELKPQLEAKFHMYCIVFPLMT